MIIFSLVLFIIYLFAVGVFVWYFIHLEAQRKQRLKDYFKNMGNVSITDPEEFSRRCDKFFI